ncbi:Leucine carboxyl methyltransferase [Gossypium australe]|uniref:Leucine carboxyl methyltransferase n=1 Tax=Gossypium australe TaxID=47621 RepID=A0A5B6VKC0_9ROSI|nr:Leucine carboxyl methyltransferase [Gossypium australe]
MHGDNYKLLLADLFDIQKLDDFITLAKMEPGHGSKKVKMGSLDELMLKAVAWDMRIYSKFVDAHERCTGLLNVTYLVIRIEPLELFDEFEEWHMLQGLYAKLGYPDDRQHVSDTSLGNASP